jgi:hypothetical protein
MAFTINELPGYCPPGQAAKQALLSIEIYRQCETVGPDSLIKTLLPEHFDGSGNVSMEATATYTPIVTSASTAPVANTYASRPVVFTLPVLKDAFSLDWEELVLGQESVESTLMTGTRLLITADNVGEAVTTRLVIAKYYRTAKSATPFVVSVMPNCEIMATGAMSVGAGKNLVKQITLNAMPVDRSYAGYEGTSITDGRVFSYWEPTEE